MGSLSFNQYTGDASRRRRLPVCWDWHVGFYQQPKCDVQRKPPARRRRVRTLCDQLALSLSAHQGARRATCFASSQVGRIKYLCVATSLDLGGRRPAHLAANDRPSQKRSAADRRVRRQQGRYRARHQRGSCTRLRHRRIAKSPRSGGRPSLFHRPRRTGGLLGLDRRNLPNRQCTTANQIHRLQNRLSNRSRTRNALSIDRSKIRTTDDTFRRSPIGTRSLL